MTCQEYERRWMEHLDRRGHQPLVLEPAIEEHVASCPVCRSISLKYRTLHQAIVSLGVPPVPSVDFVERCLDAQRSAPVVLPLSVRARSLVRWAAAAVVLFAGTLLFRTYLGRQPAGERPANLAREVPPARPLVESLGQATSATLDLAWETSAPAARLGRTVIQTTSVPEPSFSVPGASGPTSEMLQSFGDRFEAGVRPISGSARRAFSFLLPSVPAPEPRPAAFQKGA
jgi:hypothetical protein